MKLKLNRIVSLFAVLSLLVFAVVANAADDTEALPSINDGRINNLDVAAPVAIYDFYSYPYADDVNLGVLDHIEFWGLTGSGTFDKVLNVTTNDIQAVEVTDGTSALIASGFGYSLYKEADGTLTLVAPSDAEGKTYEFNWTQAL